MSEVTRALRVARKELRDHSRDLRSVLSALLFPLLGPVTVAILFQVLASWTAKDKAFEVAMTGRAAAPALVAFLERQGATVKDAPPDYEARLQDGTLDVVVLIDERYAERFSAGKQAPLSILRDSSRTKAAIRAQRVQQLIAAYGAQVGSLRLLARGVSPELAAPLKLEEIDLATPQQHGAQILGVIRMFLIFAAFAGGMYVAIDVTAGERERGSLEPLLVCRVSRGALVTGKWLATVAAALLAVLIGVAAFAAVVRLVPLSSLGLKVKFGPAEMAAVLAAVAPLTLFASALQMLLSTMARSFKEAQTYLQLFMLLPFIPSTYLMMAPAEPRLWMQTIPVLGQDMLLTQILRGDPASPAAFAIGAGVSVALSLICLAGTARLFHSERIIFGR